MTWMTGNFRMTPARRQTHNSNKYDRQVSGVGTLHHCNCHLLYCTLHYCGYCLPLNDNMSFISQAVRSRQCHLFISLWMSCSQCPHMRRVCQTLESRGGEVLAVSRGWRPSLSTTSCCWLEAWGPMAGEAWAVWTNQRSDQAVHGTYVYIWHFTRMQSALWSGCQCQCQALTQLISWFNK